MPRTTKSLTAKAKHKKVLSATKVIMEQEAGFQNCYNLILNQCNTHLEIEKIKSL